MKFILQLILIYAFIFNPILSFGSFGTIKILYPFLLVGILNISFKKKLNVVKKNNYQYLLILLFIILRTFLGGNSSFIYIGIVNTIELTLLPLLILYLFKDSDLIKSIVICGSIASLISTMCFFSPAMKSIVDGLQLEEEYLSFNLYRGFGFAEGRTFSYSIIQAIILFFIFNRRDLIKYLVLFPCFLISIFFNARTGITILILGLILTLFQQRNKIRSILFVGLLLACFMMFILTNIDIKAVSDSFMFAYEGLLQMVDIVTGSSMADSNTMESLNSRSVLPNNVLSWIIGDGIDAFHYYPGCDTGWNNQLLYGGLIYMFLIYMYFLNMCKTAYSKANRYFIYLAVGTVIIANLKGNLMGTNGAYRLILLVLYYFIFNNYKLSRLSIQKLSINNKCTL